MYGLRFLIVCLGLTVLAFWTFAGAAADKPRERTVAFDNVYGNAKRLQVHVAVDGAAEQVITAKCNAKDCTFKLRLTNARHEVTMSVDQNGKRSAPTRITLDTSGLK